MFCIFLLVNTEALAVKSGNYVGFGCVNMLENYQLNHRIDFCRRNEFRNEIFYKMGCHAPTL